MCIPILCTNALHLRLKIERDLCLELQLSLTGKSLLFHIRLLATHMGTADVVTRPKIAMTSLESYKKDVSFRGVDLACMVLMSKYLYYFFDFWYIELWFQPTTINEIAGEWSMTAFVTIIPAATEKNCYFCQHFSAHMQKV